MSRDWLDAGHPRSAACEPLDGATLMPAGHRVRTAEASHEQAQKLLASRPGFEVAVATGSSEAELVERIPAYDGIIVRSKTRVTAPVIAAGQKLKVIGRAGIG